MKILNKLVFIAFAIAVFASCKKDEQKVEFLGGTPPALTASVADSIPLGYTTAANTAVTLNWTNPNYQFNTGVSSLDVTYVVEIDTAGANFTNPNRQTISIGKNLSLSLTQTQLNDYLLNQLVLKADMVHTLEVRVTSQMTSASAKLMSNVLTFKARPYSIPPKVNPPASGELFITGSATPGNWMGGGDAPLASQKFTQLSPTLYEIVIALTGGNSYTFVPVYGNWDKKYSIKTKNDPAEVNGGDFQEGGEDILAPSASGNYKIQVDFQRGKFTVTKQ